MTKKCVITGATSGIGLEIAKELLVSKEWSIISISRNKDKIREAKKILGSEMIDFYEGDISDSKQVDTFAEYVSQKFGNIDALVNNAGVIYPGGVESLALEEWAATMNINLTSVFYMTQKLLDNLKKSKRASVVNISSISSKLMGSSVAYSVCKAGVDMLTKCMAKEMASYGIRVNSVNPGITKTGFQISNNILVADKYDDFLQEIEKDYPLGVGEVEDVSKLVVFLLSDNAKWMTGSNVIIDGGRSVSI